MPEQLKTASAADSAAASGDPAGGPDLKKALDWFGRFATLIGFAVMFVAFWVAEPSIFPTWDNIRTILESTAPILILAVGLTVVLCSGEFDLSFTGLVGLAGVASVQAMVDWGAGTVAAVLLGLAVGVAGGVVAGLLVAAQRTSSFIATLALGTVWTGLALAISGGGVTISGVTHAYGDITFNDVGGIPLVVIYALVVVIVAFAMMRWTVFGRQTLALGANRGAARLAGVRVGVTQVAAFGFHGLCAGVAAVLLTSQTQQWSADIAGGLFIPPYVAAFFGISVLAAGRFNVFGTLVGALFVATLQTGLTVVGSEAYVANIVTGLTLIVILFVAAQSRSAR